MSKPKHTPTPWKTVKPGHGNATEYLCVQIGKDDRYTTLELEPADAKFIVRACNAHAALLEACYAAIEGFEDVKPGCIPVLDMMRAAIAKAEETVR